MDIITQLKRDEGLRLEPYKDTTGNWTVGYGHNLDVHQELPHLITEDQADAFLAADVQTAEQSLSAALPWTCDLDEVRQGVLVNMCFNMGINALLGFHRTLAMIEAGNYEGAAEAMLDSLWARQVGARATRLSQQLVSGEWM